MELNKILKDIKNLKIQGAVNVAIAGTKSLNNVAQKSKTKTKKQFVNELKKTAHRISNVRINEPELNNGLKYILNLKSRTVPDLKKEVQDRTNYVLKHYKESKEYIAHIGSLKIKSRMTLFTHCHSSTVIKIFQYAKKRKKNFIVHNTETRPLYQGRKTARELAKLKIPVFHYIDSAAGTALKDADIMFIGADAITTNGDVINKIGSRLIAEMAENYNTKIYVCTDSWAYDSRTKSHKIKIERRDPSEIWEKVPKGIKVINPAFDIIPAKYISGIISELGFYKPENFIRKVKKTYKWIK